MPTATEIREDKAFVESQGLMVTVLDQAREGRTWYKPDGTPLPNLPADMYHRTRYRLRGWTLEPPGGVLPAPVAEVKAVMGVTAPPKHIHVMQEAIGSPCLVMGCTHKREMRNIISKNTSKGKRSGKTKEIANEQ